MGLTKICSSYWTSNQHWTSNQVVHGGFQSPPSPLIPILSKAPHSLVLLYTLSLMEEPVMVPKHWTSNQVYYCSGENNNFYNS